MGLTRVKFGKQQNYNNIRRSSNTLKKDKWKIDNHVESKATETVILPRIYEKIQYQMVIFLISHLLV